MKYAKLVLAAVTAISFTAACSVEFGSKNPQPTTAPTPAASETASSPTPRASAPDGLAGTYSITGESPKGDRYQGSMTITERDEVLQLSWRVGESNYDGIGIRMGETLAAAYTTGDDGRGCGAVIYKINPDDSIEGKWGLWGVNQAGHERAVPTGAVTGTNGTFDVDGRNADGSAYKGTLKVSRSSEDVYQFSWDVGSGFVGTGIKMGDYLAAGSGSRQCGFAIYGISGNRLNGRWGVPGAMKLGTETAEKAN